MRLTIKLKLALSFATVIALSVVMAVVDLAEVEDERDGEFVRY